MKSRRIASFLLMLSLLFGVIFVPCSFDANAQSYAQTYLDKQMETNDISGVVSVTQNGNVICQSARGMANTAQSKEMTIDTLFPIGSNSKQFCATAILILMEQGKLSLTEPITDYFPEYTRAEGITIKNLLTMRSGIRDYANDGLSDEDFIITEHNTKEENRQIVLEWIYDSPLLYKADNGHNYSNTNYFLLSLIVEQVSGQNYWDFIKENIFIPLELNNTGIYEEMANHPDLAEHTFEDGIMIDPQRKGFAQGAGDIVSNAEDMAKWFKSYREYTILSKETIEEMTTSYSVGFSYGYGIMAGDKGQIYHTGASDTYISITIYYPKDDFCIFAVTNYWKKSGDAIESLAYNLDEKFHLNSIYGDVNFDNDVNIKDATMIQKAAAEIVILNEAEKLCADVNSDSNVNVKDATAIQKYAAEIDTNIPIGESIIK